MSESPYPEHDKLKIVHSKSNAAGQVLDWLLNEKGYVLMEWLSEWSNGVPRYIDTDGNPTDELQDEDARWGRQNRDNPDYEYRPEDHYMVRRTIHELLAEYFKIDLEKIDAEKEAMLARMRELNT